MAAQIVEVGVALQERAPGSHITFVDPRRHADAGAVVRSARRLVGLFRARGVKASNLVVSIPATEAGVAAARELQSAGINTALDLVASLMHAVACSEARAAAISIPVGAVLVSHQRKRGADPAAAYLDLEAQPGVESILAILEYYKLHANSTRIVGRDLGRGELAAAALRVLPGFDAVCLSKTQLNAARWATLTERGFPLAARRDRTPPPPGTHAAASLRARQAQHPTLFRTGDFMGQLSGAARGVVAATLYSALRTMERQMDAVQELVRKEVASQLAQATLSLDALYALQDADARAQSPVAKKQRGEGVRRARTQGWSSASGSEKQRQRSPPGDLIEGVEYF
ncbi:hypothetical protein GGX14DRAFT_371660 [Mycena pura]|uniref:Transaldolase n=1 Tax=Mycena pura TaxID=153505 RepID=A0AAD6V6G3_9AGAR|nr:hypothetical protein GGX14DRAFT_371660 [Mycena pura]